ncbi:MAG: 3-deoxy-manno-octulosonate cytidylyltransferase [Planctomycetes bacterium]|nr:3-deoxy-manno-octulosonate cytidylyltransferase [Planctomycetota bacterium]
MPSACRPRTGAEGDGTVATGIIPARYGSTRLPAKALAIVAGKTLIRHVVANARRARRLGRILVATDDERIAAEARLEGAEAVLTRADHPSGTDRVAEAAATVEDGIIVNIQGDEPEIDPEVIDAVVALLEDQPDLDLATAAAPLESLEEFLSPHRVKVVLDDRNRALYFSRAPIPHPRRDGAGVIAALPEVEALGHIGIYGYRRDALVRLVALPPSPLEDCEKLEQLRALQAGMKIGVAKVARARAGIDTAADLSAFETRLGTRRAGGA